MESCCRPDSTVKNTFSIACSCIQDLTDNPSISFYDFDVLLKQIFHRDPEV